MNKRPTAIVKSRIKVYPPILAERVDHTAEQQLLSYFIKDPVGKSIPDIMCYSYLVPKAFFAGDPVFLMIQVQDRFPKSVHKESRDV